MLYKDMATRIVPSILAWSTPLTEKPGRPQYTGLQRVGHDRNDLVCTDARLLLMAALPQ